MRDPELVFKAQLAASALERAWQHWRVIHGLLADPMPAISSYVGYSLEAPWGQPRVVLGLAAADAEQLTALLERHDCGGPVHAVTAAEPGSRGLLAGADGTPGRPLPVPPQAPFLHAERKISANGLSGTAEIRHATDQPDDQDGPVYRQLAAALRAARDAAADEEPREPEAAEQEPEGREPETGQHEPEGREPETGQQEPEGREPETGQQEPEGREPETGQQEPAVKEPAGQEPAGQEPAGQEPARPQQPIEEQVGDEPAGREAVIGSDGDGDGRSDHAADIGAGSTDSRTSSKSQNSRTGGDAGLNQDSEKSDSSAADRRAGPRKAGSRRAGEGRSNHNRSAASRSGAARGNAAHDKPADLADNPADEAMPGNDEATADSDAAGKTLHGPGPLAIAASAARAAAEARIRAAGREASSPALERPEVAGPGPGDIAAAWGGPGFLDEGAEEPEVGRFWPWSQSAADAEGDPEPGRSAAEPRHDPQASYAKRNRIARGYSIPRLSRAKRPGSVPGS
jgi:hypothetical protein